MKLSFDTNLNTSKAYLIAGPESFKSPESKQIIETLKRACKHVSVPFVLRASAADTAEDIEKTKDEFQVPVFIDVISNKEYKLYKDVVDIISIYLHNDKTEYDMVFNDKIVCLKNSSVTKSYFPEIWAELLKIKDRLILCESLSEYESKVQLDLDILNKQKEFHTILDCSVIEKAAPMLAECGIVAGCNGIVMKFGPKSVDPQNIIKLVNSINVFFTYQKWKKESGAYYV